MNYFNDQLPVGLLTQLIRGLYQYHTGQGLNLSKARIFQAFFLQLLKVHLSMWQPSFHLFGMRYISQKPLLN